MEQVDLMTLADGDGVEDLTEEMKEKLRKEFKPSDSDEGEPAPDYVTNGVEWTMGKAEAEPEVDLAKPSVQTKQSSEESSEDEDDWTRRNRRPRRRRPASRELRRSKAEDESTWTRGAWELTKQALKNVLCIWGIICLLAMLPSTEAKAEGSVVTGYDCLRPTSSRVITAETACVMQPPDLGRTTEPGYYKVGEKQDPADGDALPSCNG